MEDRGLEPLSASDSKTPGTRTAAETSGAYLVYCGMKPARWDQLRRLILNCDDLSDEVREQIIELGDEDNMHLP